MEQQIQQLKQFLIRLPHAKLSALVTLLVVVYLAFLLSKLVWLMWPNPVVSPLTPMHYANQTKGVAGNRSTQHIVEQFLFGKKVATNNSTTRQSQVINNAPETRLSINLTGIVAVSHDDKAGVAIIESQGKQISYLAEEVIQGTRAKVAQILPDRVILSVSGGFETLMLDGLDFTKKVSMPVLAARDDSEMGPQMLIASNDQKINATADPQVREALIETREELLEEPGKLFDYIRVSQAMSDGVLIGYRLSPGKEPELFKQMGLQNNDLAIAINGYQLTDLKQAMSAINELRNSTDANITIERDGEQLDVQFSL
ncbi:MULTISPECIES: type II secretion system protein GspC [unclassified Pseudoalteromonas]|uniref:type II secretion system protein GspC n=1 Tax=unclassified Pseudoalteromonas TaxID=194690 RepID=UPI000BBE6A68|nr:type II secretion system protein GspC [Pseudoalteromonas sp. 1_2015MBL_MicDiv]ATG76279.1 type II secretion system protein GspC [Pseudoalteromonas sp. 1_2015MBL_MicDiv]